MRTSVIVTGDGGLTLCVAAGLRGPWWPNILGDGGLYPDRYFGLVGLLVVLNLKKRTSHSLGLIHNKRNRTQNSWKCPFTLESFILNAKVKAKATSLPHRFIKNPI